MVLAEVEAFEKLHRQIVCISMKVSVNPSEALRNTVASHNNLSLWNSGNNYTLRAEEAAVIKYLPITDDNYLGSSINEFKEARHCLLSVVEEEDMRNLCTHNGLLNHLKEETLRDWKHSQRTPDLPKPKELVAITSE
ncbi:hypothetical protein RUM44_002686 [Polyplax serrata]|uniref:Uncharacterized protein n=1 Tax=Polyplax serrata TaxID=468196 RepID=A0ABR1AFG1_POLSC